MSYKKNVARFLVLVLMISLPQVAVYAKDISSDLSVNAKSAVLIEASTGKILLSQNANEKLPPASVTKIMTLLLIYEAEAQKKISWDDVVSISEYASSMGGSQVFLEPGEQQKASELTKCIAIASANDAAVAMAEFIGGSEEAFVKQMNDKAKEIGMMDTTFKNSCGLDLDGHVTSAYDIALMSRELIRKYPQVMEYTKVWQDEITHKTKRGDSQFGLTNTNKLLKWYNGATGLKTGSTGKALYCLSGTAEKNGLSLISVVLAAPDYKTRFHEVMKMLDYGFANFAVSGGEPEGTVMGALKVYRGNVQTVDVAVGTNVNIVTKKGTEPKLESKVELKEAITAPVPKGEKVGELVYYVDGEEAARCDLVTVCDVEKASVPDMFKRVFDKWFM